MCHYSANKNVLKYSLVVFRVIFVEHPVASVGRYLSDVVRKKCGEASKEMNDKVLV